MLISCRIDLPLNFIVLQPKSKGVRVMSLPSDTGSPSPLPEVIVEEEIGTEKHDKENDEYNEVSLFISLFIWELFHVHSNHHHELCIHFFSM